MSEALRNLNLQVPWGRITQIEMDQNCTQPLGDNTDKSDQS